MTVIMTLAAMGPTKVRSVAAMVNIYRSMDLYMPYSHATTPLCVHAPGRAGTALREYSSSKWYRICADIAHMLALYQRVISWCLSCRYVGDRGRCTPRLNVYALLTCDANLANM
jgi:hypothetical protein